MSNLRRILASNEFLVFLTLVVLCAIIGLANPNFFSLANIFRLLRSATVPGIFALGVLVVLISGGIDVSFPAIAVFALYGTVQLINSIGIEATLLEAFGESGAQTANLIILILALGIGGLIGMLLGLVNAFFIAVFRLPTLIVTLGTLNMFAGFLRFFIGSVIERNLPDGMTNLSRSNVLELRFEGSLPANLNVTILFFIISAIAVFFILRYTMMGRGIYAMGGDLEAAERAGFNIRRIQFFIYIFVGFLAGIGGILFGSLARQANPFDIVGSELDVIAAVVLGGASIAGGRGSVIGTLLGVLIITIIQNNLVLLGIDSEWQKVVIGIFVIAGVSVPVLRERWRKRRT